MIARSDDPGRLGRSAYHLIHPVMVAGIIVCAAADEKVLADPGAAASTASAWMILGGPALFLAGHAAFKLVVWRVLSWPRLAGIAMLGLLALAAHAIPALALGTCAAAVVIVVAVSDRCPGCLVPPGRPDSQATRRRDPGRLRTVAAVLDALAAPAGSEDSRTQPQRYHDALQEAMHRLVAAGVLPERAGQPVKIWAHISLADLLRLEGSSALQEEWAALVRARWAGHRAAASEGGGDSGAWLDGDAAEAIACDAAMAPVVTGDVNLAALEDLVRLCTELGKLRHGSGDADAGTGDERGAPGLAWEALEQAIIGKAVDLLSGPGGLASFLRRRQLGVRLGGPSLPLDIGYSETIPAGIRNAVVLRDRHCQFAGRCDQPAEACQVHHVKHKANGGPTSVKDCVLLCWFHHQVVIHRWGWTLVLNPDGTTIAWNKDKTRVLHSHGPPVRPGDHSGHACAAAGSCRISENTTTPR